MQILQLENVILKLRDENITAANNLVETNLRFEQKIIMLTKEVCLVCVMLYV